MLQLIIQSHAVGILFPIFQYCLARRAVFYMMQLCEHTYVHSICRARLWGKMQNDMDLKRIQLNFWLDCDYQFNANKFFKINTQGRKFRREQWKHRERRLHTCEEAQASIYGEKSFNHVYLLIEWSHWQAYEYFQSSLLTLKICLHCANTHITRPWTYGCILCLLFGNGYCFKYVRRFNF